MRRARSYDYEYIWRYPVTANDPEQTQYARALAAATVGESRVIDAARLMGAEDFSFFAQRVPSCFYTLGCSGGPQTSHPHHSSLFDIDERALAERRRDDDRARTRRTAQRSVTATVATAIPEIVEHPSAAQILEIITRAVFQTGVKWSQIAAHWDAYREAFANFDPQQVAAFDSIDVERVLAQHGVLRVPRKVKATIANAAALLAIEREFGSFHAYVASFPDYALLGKGHEEALRLSRRHERVVRAVSLRRTGPALRSLGANDTGRAPAHARDG